jgi:hypothetical protein
MIIKYLIPLVAFIGLAAGSFFGVKVLAPKPEKINYNEIRQIIAEEVRKLPKPKPQGSSIDIDKLKNFKGTFSLHQHTDIEVNGDSLILVKIQSMVKNEFENFKVKRCK